MIDLSKTTESMIHNLHEFEEKWLKHSSDPIKTIMMYLIAALNIEYDHEISENMMTLVVSKKDCHYSKDSPTKLRLGRSPKNYFYNFQDNPNIARSYVGGAPLNDYQIDETRLCLHIVREETVGERRKIFIKSEGKDLDTPAQLQQNRNGQWKLVEYSSICTGVKESHSTKNDF